MSIACFIPIKANSERVKGKNFRVINGKKLYEYAIEHAIQANIFDVIYVDSNSLEVKEYCEKMGVEFIVRDERLAANNANGNDLLNSHYQMYPDFDFYVQLFVTAPYLQPSSIKDCVEKLIGSNVYDSCFTAVQHSGFFWLNNTPINYRPCILPRSQDLNPMIEESTGLYGISKMAIDKYHCRVGATPYIHLVNKFEAVDINTEEDLQLAEYIGKQYWKY